MSDPITDPLWQDGLPALAFRLLDTLRSAPEDGEDFLQFLGFAAGLAKMARGQLFQDLWALWETRGKRGGYFVEFGGGDGETLSNTWLLEKHHGWTGIVADPNPGFSNLLRARRDCFVSTDCVWSQSGETLAFLPARMGELSRLRDVDPGDFIEAAGLRRTAPGAEVAVPTISLRDLLEQAGAPREIDFLSVDTEGSEYEILAAFDFGGWRFSAICVEHNWTARREDICALLTGRGYRRKWAGLTQQDDWYVPAD